MTEQDKDVTKGSGLTGKEGVDWVQGEKGHTFLIPINKKKREEEE